uniref:Peptidoglycan recognition protein family domain-containing protein n=1 Tax=Timema monikensis TaxID=170555 RepID=A0A7R9EFU4_9NEOP|nr:unnamed protein product [Timema monikensis]
MKKRGDHTDMSWAHDRSYFTTSERGMGIGVVKVATRYDTASYYPFRLHAEGDELSTGQPELDERQPLLSNLPAITCKKCSINAFLVLLLVVLLFGGLGIAIWLAILSNTKGGGNIAPDKNFALVKRSSWGARTADLPSELLIPHTPVDYVIIIHTDTTICNTSASCVNQMKVLQNHSMDNKHLSDIPYNFLIGGDGNVYEGRGFKIQGAFVPKWNIKSFGLAFIEPLLDFDIVDRHVTCKEIKEVLEEQTFYQHRSVDICIDLFTNNL